MDRPFFDPTRRKRSEPGGGSPAGPLSVRQVNDLVTGALARHVPATLHVLGEIGNFSRPASGHLYFTLKDAASELRCIMWKTSAARLRFAPEVGMEVIATGGLEVYAQRGCYQLLVRQLEPRGVGALEVAFRQLKERLERAGLFDPARKRPLPRIPERIAIVTSPRGAALRDVLRTLERRYPALEIYIFPVRVQGAGAAEEIAGALRWLSRHAADLGGLDVVIATRGGGSLEDLWAFNEEVVARAIYACDIPVVSAVGHEVDITISDLVADVRAATPTAAAELIAPPLAELCSGVDQARGRAQRALAHLLRYSRARLERALACEGLARPRSTLRHRGQLLDELGHRLRHGWTRRQRAATEALGRLELRMLRIVAGRKFALAERALDARVQRLIQAFTRRRSAETRRLQELTTRLHDVSPQARIMSAAQGVRSARERLIFALGLRMAGRRARLEGLVREAGARSPQHLLSKGYSIVRDARMGAIIRSVTQVRDGQRLITRLGDGEFRSTADDPRQPGLFEGTTNPT